MAIATNKPVLLMTGFVVTSASVSPADALLILQLREKVLLRQQGSYILTVEAGRQLLLSADTRAEAALQEELLDIQERWRHANIRLEEQKKELAVLLRVEIFMIFTCLIHLLYLLLPVWISLVILFFQN